MTEVPVGQEAQVQDLRTVRYHEDGSGWIVTVDPGNPDGMAQSLGYFGGEFWLKNWSERGPITLDEFWPISNQRAAKFMEGIAELPVAEPVVSADL